MIIAAKVIYFNYKGTPARYESKKFPIQTVKGKEIVIYDLEKFFRESSIIDRREYEKMSKNS